MKFSKEYFDYAQTNSFSKIILDYLSAAKSIEPFYRYFPNKENVLLAMQDKAKSTINRTDLVGVLNEAYKTVIPSEATKKNIEKLLLPDTFTICTAHQPNIFTGHLYFIYKILHTITLANFLQQEIGTGHFVPVFYMGTEDADLEELGHIYLDGEKVEWKTNQKGAVGRMLVDQALLDIVKRITGEFGSTSFGKEMTDLLKSGYTIGRSIQEATFELINALFGKYGLVILIADDPMLKKQMIPVFKEEILSQNSSRIVNNTSAKLAAHYKEQAYARDINLFYFKDSIRERIEKDAAGNYRVVNTDLVFSEAEILYEIETNPRHFSPNVILRGLFQETILPNIVFIGGGGELSYWLQLKGLFENYQVPFPILLLRNSFLLCTKRQLEAFQKLQFPPMRLFEKTLVLEKEFTISHSKNQLDTKPEKDAITTIYENLGRNAAAIDKTLLPHIQALKTKQLNKLTVLEKKLLRAEKRNLKDGINKIHNIKNSLFPGGGLQERYENIIPYYSKYGPEILDILLENSLNIESKFCLITLP